MFGKRGCSPGAIVLPTLDVHCIGCHKGWVVVCGPQGARELYVGDNLRRLYRQEIYLAKEYPGLLLETSDGRQFYEAYLQGIRGRVRWDNQYYARRDRENYEFLQYAHGALEVRRIRWWSRRTAYTPVPFPASPLPSGRPRPRSSGHERVVVPITAAKSWRTRHTPASAHVPSEG